MNNRIEPFVRVHFISMWHDRYLCEYVNDMPYYTTIRIYLFHFFALLTFVAMSLSSPKTFPFHLLCAAPCVSLLSSFPLCFFLSLVLLLLAISLSLSCAIANRAHALWRVYMCIICMILYTEEKEDERLCQTVPLKIYSFYLLYKRT